MQKELSKVRVVTCTFVAHTTIVYIFVAIFYQYPYLSNTIDINLNV